MATAAKGKSALVQKAQTQQTVIEVAGPSRREFLYYIWGASMVMILGQAGAGLVWFSLPRFKEGEFGGVFNFASADLPSLGDAPQEVPEGRLWISNSASGFVTLYAVCTHLGCLPDWKPTNDRFECPCHGSKFEIDGIFISGPAPRSLDRYAFTLEFTDGTTASSSNGQPIPLEGREIASLAVDTGARVNGPS